MNLSMKSSSCAMQCNITTPNLHLLLGLLKRPKCIGTDEGLNPLSIHSFEAHLHSCKKCILLLSCLPFHPSVSEGWISMKPILGTSTKICQETPNLVKIRQKYQAFHMKTHIYFIVPGDINTPKNSFLCNTQYFYIGEM